MRYLIALLVGTFVLSGIAFADSGTEDVDSPWYDRVIGDRFSVSTDSCYTRCAPVKTECRTTVRTTTCCDSGRGYRIYNPYVEDEFDPYSSAWAWMFE